MVVVDAAAVVVVVVDFYFVVVVTDFSSVAGPQPRTKERETESHTLSSPRHIQNTHTTEIHLSYISAA